MSIQFTRYVPLLRPQINSGFQFLFIGLFIPHLRPKPLLWNIL